MLLHVIMESFSLSAKRTMFNIFFLSVFSFRRTQQFKIKDFLPDAEQDTSSVLQGAIV